MLLLMQICRAWEFPDVPELPEDPRVPDGTDVELPEDPQQDPRLIDLLGPSDHQDLIERMILLQALARFEFYVRQASGVANQALLYVIPLIHSLTEQWSMVNQFLQDVQLHLNSIKSWIKTW